MVFLSWNSFGLSEKQPNWTLRVIFVCLFDGVTAGILRLHYSLSRTDLTLFQNSNGYRWGWEKNIIFSVIFQQTPLTFQNYTEHVTWNPEIISYYKLMKSHIYKSITLDYNYNPYSHQTNKRVDLCHIALDRIDPKCHLQYKSFWNKNTVCELAQRRWRSMWQNSGLKESLWNFQENRNSWLI